MLLGVYPFAAGTSGYIELTNQANNQYVIADAVRFVYQLAVPETGTPSGLSAVVPSDVLIDLTWQDNSDNETGF